MIAKNKDEAYRWRAKVMLAYADGATIESKPHGAMTWLADEFPSFDWGIFDYRVMADGKPVSELYGHPIAVVVTRRSGLVDLLVALRLCKPDVTVLKDVTDFRQISGLHVAGELPHHLSCLCKYYTRLTFDIPAERRKEQLSASELSEMLVDVRTYRVNIVDSRVAQRRGLLFTGEE